MRKLLQTVDVEMCFTLFKKGMASLIILSMLMSDVVNAMEDEHEPLLIQRAHSPKSPITDREVPIEIIDDFFSKRDSSSDELDSSTGSISTSPEKSTPEGEKSLATSPVINLSLILSQSSSLPVPSPLDVTKNQPSPLPIHSDPTSESLHRLEGVNHETPSTVEEGYFPIPLSRSLGSSPLGGSLQERSSSFIPPSQSIAESSHNNSPPPTSELVLFSVNFDDSEEPSSEIDSTEETDILLEESQQNKSCKSSIQFTEGKRRLFSAPASFSGQYPFDENSRLLQTVSPKYSIQVRDRSNADPEDDGFVFKNPLPDEEEDESECCSCCSNRPLLPQPTEYTLRGATTLDEVLHKIQKRSELLTGLPSDHHSVSSNDSSDSLNFEDSDSSSPHESPPKVVRGGGVLLPSDEDFDDLELALENPPLPSSSGYQRLVDLPSLTDEVPVFPVPSPLLVNQEGELTAILSHIGSLSPQEGLKYILNDLKELPAKTKTQLINLIHKNILDGLKGLPAKTKKQLIDFTHQIFHGKSTWSQRLGKWVIGPLIGGGFAWAMGPIYDGGVDYLSNQSEAFNEFLNGNAGSILILYIQISAGPDGISRNAHLWKKGIGYLAREGKEIGRMCLASFISTLTACIPLSYLISAENLGRQLSGFKNWNNGFGVIIAIFGPPIYLDAFASDFNIAWFALPQMKEWLGKLWCRPSSHVQLPVFLDAPRERFDNDLKSLEYFLYRAPQAVINEIYDNIKQVKEGVQVPLCGNYDEALASQQAFAVLSYLLSLGDDVVQGVSKPKSIYDIATDVFKYACLILGSPARAVTLQFIGYSVFSLFCADPVAQILGGIYALLAFLPQTFMEDQGMDNFFKHFLVTEEPDGHKAHPIYRGITQLFCSLQGLIYVFPLAVTALQAFQQWSGAGWWPLLVSIPFLIPEGASQIYSFNGTFNQLMTTSVINGCHKIGGKCKGDSLCSPCKKDWLIRFVQTSRENLPHWENEFVDKLLEGVDIFKK